MPDTPSERPFDSRDFRNALGRFATGVTIVTTEYDGETRGMTCNGFMSVSLEPPLIVISVAHTATIHDMLAEGRYYGVSILSSAQEHLSNHFAGRPIDDLDDPFIRINDVPLIKDCAVYLIAKVVDAHPAGDHTLFIGEVEYLQYSDDDTPLLFYAGKYAGLAKE